MNIRVSQSGGFAGARIELADVDTATIPAAQAEKLERLVHDAAFFGLPARADAERGTMGIGADNSLRYEITVKDEGRSHTVSFADSGVGGVGSLTGGLGAIVAAVTQAGES